MKKVNKILLVLSIIAMTLFVLTACGTTNQQEETTATQTPTLTGQTLQIYCGAGMTKPFTEIADAFKAETGCEMNVVYANAAQLQSQINTTQEGDLFIAGAADELKPVQEYVSGSKDLVKHIPVLAVQKGNPLGITGLADLTKDGVEVVLGDAEATPIGKLSNKALTDAGILEKVNVLARCTTAPEIATALSQEECDAVIVWKENANNENIDMIDTTDLDSYIKTVPAASLSFSQNTEALAAFLDYLNSDAVKAVWEKYGYEVLN